MYTHTDYNTKKELRAAVNRGDVVTYFQPGPFGGNEPTDGTIYVEGPHYPRPHRWYAECTVKNGRIVAVR